MEVHKPKLVTNWRELFKEWGIIVLGVLTALLAEQAVQSIEWRHKVDAAITDMSNELSGGDAAQGYVRMAIRDCVEIRLDAIRAAVEAGDRARARRIIDGVWLPNNTYDSLSRESASASDVTSHMPEDRMLNFRIAFDVVPQLDRLADRELTDLAALRALPTSGGPLGTSEKLAANSAVEALRMENETMDRDADFLLLRMYLMGLGIDRARFNRLLDSARSHYPDCITSPHRRLSQPDRISAIAWSRSNK